MLGFNASKKDFLRVAAAVAVAVSASACSSLPSAPDWVDPTSWFGGDSSAPAADNGQTPDLAAIPDKPGASSSDSQKEVSDSLSADRSHAQYSADALRGGTEAAAAPPPTVTPSQVASDVLPGSETDNANRTGRNAKTAAAAPAPAPAPARVAQVDRSVSQAPTGNAMPGTLPPVAPGPVSQEASATPPPAVESAPLAPPPETQTASAPPPPEPQMAAAAPPPAATMPPPGAQPAVPPAPAVPQQMASISPSDAALGFKPSTAPPLDPSISQFVAPPIINHYQQTAAMAGIAGTPSVAVASAKHSTKLRRPGASMAMGGPERMSGAVVANLDSLLPSGVSQPSVYANAQGLPPTAVVFFPGDSVYLSSAGREQVRVAAEQYKSNGGQGFIRVVGHSSSRTPNMPVERHLEIIFQKSQQRADAVAQELIHDGVPANKVLVSAVGDSQPVYYESMPKGEDGNRRAEIFLQS